MKSFEVPDEIAPLVEMLLEIRERDREDGRAWNYTVESLKGLLDVAKKHEAERGGQS
jgi:hypothetical protein